MVREDWILSKVGAEMTSVASQALQNPKGGDEMSSLKNQITSLQDRCKRIGGENETLRGELNIIQEKPLPNATLQEI